MRISKKYVVKSSLWLLRWLAWPLVLVAYPCNEKTERYVNQTILSSVGGSFFFALSLLSLCLEGFPDGIKISLAIGFFVMYLLFGLFIYFDDSNHTKKPSHHRAW